MAGKKDNTLFMIGAVLGGILLFQFISNSKQCKGGFETFANNALANNNAVVNNNVNRNNGANTVNKEWVQEVPTSVIQPAVNNNVVKPPAEVYQKNMVAPGVQPGCKPADERMDAHLIFKDGQVPRDYIVDDEVQAPTVLKSEDLRPNDAEANAWSDVNPEGTGSLAYKNFLEAGHHIGQTQILRNSYYGLRAEYPNPQANVGPWRQATIVPNPHYSQNSDICVWGAL